VVVVYIRFGNTNIKGDLSMDLLTTINNVGFPIAVSVYLLVRFEGKLEALTLSINDLSTTIKNLLVNTTGK
jgi:hypothetical protein